MAFVGIGLPPGSLGGPHTVGPGGENIPWPPPAPSESERPAPSPAGGQKLLREGGAAGADRVRALFGQTGQQVHLPQTPEERAAEQGTPFYRFGSGREPVEVTFEEGSLEAVGFQHVTDLMLEFTPEQVWTAMGVNPSMGQPFLEGVQSMIQAQMGNAMGDPELAGALFDAMISRRIMEAEAGVEPASEGFEGSTGFGSFDPIAILAERAGFNERETLRMMFPNYFAEDIIPTDEEEIKYGPVIDPSLTRQPLTEF